MDKEKVVEQYEDSMFKLLMYEYAEKEGQQILDEADRLNANADSDLPDGLDIGIYKKIDAIYSAKARRAKVHKIEKRLSKVAIIVLACGIVFATLFSSVSAFRETVYRLISSNEFLNTDTNLREAENQINSLEIAGGDEIVVPVGTYLPSWIPEGYSLKSYNSKPGEVCAVFGNNQNNLILYFEYENDQMLGIDTENVDIVENIMVRNFNGILLTKETVVSVTWADTERNILCRIKSSAVDKESILKIAESVKQK